jgi:hypothetical protein
MESTLNFQNEKSVKLQFREAIKEKALYKVIFGILREWDLSQEELAILVGRQPTTISEWKKKESISLSKTLAPNDYQILELIELYKVLTNIFVSINDRVSWLREANVGLGHKSPLELIKEDPRNLPQIRKLMSKIANP